MFLVDALSLTLLSLFFAYLQIIFIICHDVHLSEGKNDLEQKYHSTFITIYWHRFAYPFTRCDKRFVLSFSVQHKKDRGIKAPNWLFRFTMRQKVVFWTLNIRNITDQAK